jgi:hypothetical protein
MDVRRSDLPLLLHWIQARVLVILRTPRAAFFSLIFPLILLALLNGTNSGNSVTAAGGKVDFAQYFTPSIGIYALAVSCYTTPIFGLANARDQGILKRIRGTPLSPWIYLTSWLAGGIVTGLAAMTVMVIVSIPAFHLHVYPQLLPAALVTALPRMDLAGCAPAPPEPPGGCIHRLFQPTYAGERLRGERPRSDRAVGSRRPRVRSAPLPLGIRLPGRRAPSSRWAPQHPPAKLRRRRVAPPPPWFVRQPLTVKSAVILPTWTW